MAKEKTCYKCTHSLVCIYFKKWELPFPTKADSLIKSYLTGITETLASCCAHYKEEKQ